MCKWGVEDEIKGVYGISKFLIVLLIDGWTHIESHDMYVGLYYERYAHDCYEHVIVLG